MLREMQRENSKHPAYLNDGKYLGNNVLDFVNNLPKARLFQQLHMFYKNFDVSEAASNIRNCSYYFFTDNFSEGINDLSGMLKLELKSIHIRKSSISVDISEEDRVRIKEKMLPEYELLDKLKKS